VLIFRICKGGLSERVGALVQWGAMDVGSEGEGGGQEACLRVAVRGEIFRTRRGSLERTSWGSKRTPWKSKAGRSRKRWEGETHHGYSEWGREIRGCRILRANCPKDEHVICGWRKRND